MLGFGFVRGASSLCMGLGPGSLKVEGLAEVGYELGWAFVIMISPPCFFFLQSCHAKKG